MSWSMVLGAEVPDDSVHRHAPFLHPERRTMKIVVNFLSAFLTVGSHSKKNKRFSCYLEPKSEITKFFSQIQFECPCVSAVLVGFNVRKFDISVNPTKRELVVTFYYRCGFSNNGYSQLRFPSMPCLFLLCLCPRLCTHTSIHFLCGWLITCDAVARLLGRIVFIGCQMGA
jgi:hypothetical protein